MRRSILGSIFQLLYRAGHWAYDPLTTIFFGPEWHRWRRTILPWVNDGTTLELNCGTGQLLDDLNERSDFVVGLDLSSSMLDAARKQKHSDSISLVRASGSILPFRDETFNSVVSTFPASYIAKQQTLDEISRVLRPGGFFLVVASARFKRFQWKRPFIHPILRVAYGSQQSMNRWPSTILEHPQLPGQWHDLPTREGCAFVWIARKQPTIRVGGLPSQSSGDKA
jgi:ubiquinone/menaquinone biosynthesis C-methylase UbiE